MQALIDLKNANERVMDYFNNKLVKVNEMQIGNSAMLHKQGESI